jgi:transcriptional regulator with XRE-family HTH domain
MQGGDYILMARRRAGLTQRELADRLGCRQATIARWERDDRHPSLEETQSAVRACGFDLAVNLVAEDRSWWPQIAVQLERSPIERLRSLAHPGDPDLVSLLDVIADIDVPAVVIGVVAGALNGWPLVLNRTGVVEICGDPAELGPALLARGLRQVKQRYELASGRALSIMEQQPPGTAGVRDLARNAETTALRDGRSVQVASLLDLLRIADAADGGARSRETLALQAVLEVQRARAAAPRTEGTDEERLQAWLDQQPAAA